MVVTSVYVQVIVHLCSSPGKAVTLPISKFGYAIRTIISAQPNISAVAYQAPRILLNHTRIEISYGYLYNTGNCGGNSRGNTKDKPDQAKELNSLGDYLNSESETFRSWQDVDDAIARSEAAMQEALEDDTDEELEDDPDQAWLDNLSNEYYSSIYERIETLQDLEAAINHIEIVVEATSEDHPDRAEWLNYLGSLLGMRYQRTGDLQDLDAAISYSQAVIEATPEGHPDRGAWFNNAGPGGRYQSCRNNGEANSGGSRLSWNMVDQPRSHFGRRYERSGNLHDLEVAIYHAEAGVKVTPEGHPDRAACWNILGSLFNKRYLRTGDLQDLESAINYTETAVGATKDEDHLDRPGGLSNLSSYLRNRYERTGNLEDLDGAINHANAAVKATPQDHPNWAAWLNNLGNRLSERYTRTGNLQDLETAIDYAKTVVRATPDDHPYRAAYLNNLGKHMNGQYEQTGNCQYLELAIASWCASWTIPTAPILTRIHAASAAANALVSGPLATQDLFRAYTLLHDATHLIPLATSRSLEREDQQHIVGKLTGLASLATAVSLQAGQSPLEALRLQELGRSVTNGQLLDYRSDISDLIKEYPTLAKDFDSLRQELDSSFPSLECPPDIAMDGRLQIQQAGIHRRNKVANDLDYVLQQIRQKPGFGTFLRAESELYLLSAAQEGPIVVLNATNLRSDAILLTKTQVTSIALPDLTQARTMKYFGKSGATDDNEVKREMLEWLWKAAVQPVLRKLGFYPKLVHPLPRMWWIGVGVLAQAPIHAAAKFTKGTVKVKMTTLQYCIPSYTSTIRALQYSRSRQQYKQNYSMLIATMPTTPGASPLSGVSKEADKIKHSLQDLCTVDILEKPNAECVLQSLPGYNIAHFACHGVSSVNPADSHLLLVKATGEVDKLRVKDIAALKLPPLRLAYLSACNTANSTAFIDEVTHIVSSFHIAGFINVIGTLWPAEDEACHKMATEFYSTLNKTDDVAVSYRHALLGLMKQKPSQPMYWAPFIHFGA
ncbi:CHAT domain-containing protein [Terfezia claveryi]|nr:CHAT domain-containing protein [Terfezia claveryi]